MTSFILNIFIRISIIIIHTRTNLGNIRDDLEDWYLEKNIKKSELHIIDMAVHGTETMKYNP